MNIKKIISEEVNDFEWAKEIRAGETSITNLKHGDQYTILSMKGKTLKEMKRFNPDHTNIDTKIFTMDDEGEIFAYGEDFYEMVPQQFIGDPGLDVWVIPEYGGKFHSHGGSWISTEHFIVAKI